MINVRMGTISRRHARLGVVVYVPGGWLAKVPSVQAEAWAIEAYAAYFVSCSMHADTAWKQALKTVQATYVQGYTVGLREAIARRAAEYAEMWPQLHEQISKSKRHGKWLPVVQLRGFDAAAVQSMYVPFQNTGRAGQDYVRGLLADMGRKANE